MAEKNHIILLCGDCLPRLPQVQALSSSAEHVQHHAAERQAAPKRALHFSSSSNVIRHETHFFKYVFIDFQRKRWEKNIDEKHGSVASCCPALGIPPQPSHLAAKVVKAPCVRIPPAPIRQNRNPVHCLGTRPSPPASESLGTLGPQDKCRGLGGPGAWHFSSLSQGRDTV